VVGVDTRACVSCHVRTRTLICVTNSGEFSYIFVCQPGDSNAVSSIGITRKDNPRREAGIA
jgi:hypothetical protein